MMRVRLTRDELDYLLSWKLLPQVVGAKVAAAADSLKSGDYILEISEDEAGDIRDLSEERLMVEGFDQNYELTETGRILESLIDKFFVSNG